jgi:hypothetical protein
MRFESSPIALHAANTGADLRTTYVRDSLAARVDQMLGCHIPDAFIINADEIADSIFDSPVNQGKGNPSTLDQTDDIHGGLSGGENERVNLAS